VRVRERERERVQTICAVLKSIEKRGKEVNRVCCRLDRKNPLEGADLMRKERKSGVGLHHGDLELDLHLIIVKKGSSRLAQDVEGRIRRRHHHLFRF